MKNIVPKCSKCGSGKFQIIEYSPDKNVYKVCLVICESCNTVVGTLDYLTNSTIISKLDSLQKQVENLLNRKS